MSTRCQFFVWYFDPVMEDFEQQLNFYHHHDGYPRYMEEDIKKALLDVSDFNIDTLKRRFPEYDSEYELEPLTTRHGDIEYVWHLFVDDDSVELQYVDLDCVNTDDALYRPWKCGKKFKKSWIIYLNKQKQVVSHIQLEVDNDTFKKAEAAAKEINMSVDDYCSKVIMDAYKSGKLQKILDNLIEEKKDEGKN